MRLGASGALNVACSIAPPLTASLELSPIHIQHAITTTIQYFNSNKTFSV